MFWFKKFISAYLLPTPFGLLFLCAGLILLWFHRAKKTRRVFLVMGFLVLLAFSVGPIPNLLTEHLQSQYRPMLNPPATIHKIVVLGAGASDKKDEPPNLSLDAASLSRLLEGIRLFHLIQKNNPDAKLILSGGRVFESPASSGKMRNTAVMLGMSDQNIVLENGSQDTREEAIHLRKILGKSPFLLVTSATHMPRAMALFQHAGTHPIAAPTQFSGARCHMFCYIPNATSLLKSDIAIHEYLGIVWARLRGYIA
ncbi:MAG: hypothetical protein A3I77_00630 [Gammaproteobacteria bacterium RIFCSPLOWO2_02_FULL_42_14]|nr:MAG: hypothetical protein A3B71_08715 [Gammaproteobacteria bacterium RIFCSPHIGHO2_02_FULL_42_43]OGT50789.1 MAG: hypothetical protein A3E54_00910 [Gammaproteobacteria bacterium RIFCSPHIGHO2_12_FULL_41_25]OGT61773.1 MAG: hypothetical protein A3I77_00630 [Gammaproteobacteria bacterium RIFCSPLOWO2_02_FULL_42_14]OGT85518.1 MAG: hypothetical protein A3G86_06820 [Gammaproteobacteria bacterium RIFCSPLOWO2_12_FULL_42_18]